MTSSFFDNAVNRKIAQTMIELLMSFRENKVSLSRLASELDVLRHSFIFLESEWNEKFDQSWTKIEIANAVSLDQGHRSVVPEQETALHEGIDEINLLLVSSFLPLSEDEWDI